MEGDNRGALKRKPSTPFKKRGAVKKGKWGSFSPDYPSNVQVPNPNDTVYRILCPSRKIGGVIGKGGGIIKNLREETKSKITVADPVPGSDERVIMMYSPPDRNLKNESEEEKLNGSMVSHCPAQDALLKVYDKIIEEDLSGKSKDDENSDIVVTVRLLVPNNMVGCLLGKGGDVIRRLRSETGANIRVLPSDHLPACALNTDELVQLQGNPLVLKKALYEVSTLLHQNPRKEKALNVAMPLRGPSHHPAGPSMWSPRNRSSLMDTPPWMDDRAHPGFGSGGFDVDLTEPFIEGEFALKVLCLASKIGGVIGKGGSNARHILFMTGASVHVEDAPASAEERVICVKAFEVLENPRSPTIEAILMLQNKVSEMSDTGVITTRLLVPSDKVGCLLGQGGSIINEMRRRTKADIRVNSKEDKPECASEGEELVQVSGSFAVAKDALAEVASRLRVRCLKDTSVTVVPPKLGPVPEYGPSEGFARRGAPVPVPAGVVTPDGYSDVKVGLHDREPLSYPVHPSGSRFTNPNSSADVYLPSNTSRPIPRGGSMYSGTAEALGTGLRFQDQYLSRSESMVNSPGPDHFNPPPSINHSYGGQSNPHQGSYSYPNGPGSYQNMPPQVPGPVPYQSPYQNPTDPMPYQHQQNSAPQSSYPNTSAQHTAYHSVPAHGYQF